MQAILQPDASLALITEAEIRLIRAQHPAYAALMVLYQHHARVALSSTATWQEYQHPRGQPGNPGQFGRGAGAPVVSAPAAPAATGPEYVPAPGYGGNPWKGGTPRQDVTYQVPVEDLHADPDRFQYRHGADEESGVVKEPTPEQVEEFDPAQAEPLGVWKDPADGKTYVVDGHHRLDLGKRTGAETMEVRYIKAATAAEAKSIGKSMNAHRARPEPVATPATAPAELLTRQSPSVQLASIDLQSAGDGPPSKIDELDDSAAGLAEMYADIWNALGITPDNIDHDELVTVSAELSHGEGILTWNGKIWEASVGSKDENGSVKLSSRHAPKGGVSIGGVFYHGGRFIPGSEYAKASPEAKAKIDESEQSRHDTRRARGSVDTGKLHESLAAHGHHELAKGEITSAKRSFNALHRHHGELVVHRLDEIAQQLQAAHNKTPEDETGIRTGFSRRLRAVQLQLEMAKAKGVEGFVSQADQEKAIKQREPKSAKEKATEIPAETKPEEPAFTGVKEDALGREYHWKDGVRVPGPEEPETKPDDKSASVKAVDPERVTIDELHKRQAEDRKQAERQTKELPSEVLPATIEEPTPTEQPNVIAEQPAGIEQPGSGQPAESIGGGNSSGSAGGDDGGRGSESVRPRIVTVREQHTKPGNPALVPAVLREHLNDAQQHGVSLAIDAMEKHGGFLNADGTGVGKTRQELAVGKHFADKGKKVVIVSPAEVIKPNWKKGTMAGSFANDSAAMGLYAKLVKGDETLLAGSIHITTYNELGKLKEHIDKDTVVIYDESHFLKNAQSARAKHGKEATDKAGSVLYATATPADKPLHIAHLAKASVFGNAGKTETYEKLGMKLVDQHVGGGQYVKCWQIDPKVGYKEAARRLSGLFDQLTKDGLMVKREMSMDRVDVALDRVSLSDEQHKDIQRVFDDKMRDTSGNKAVSLMAARLHQEPLKIPHTVAAVQEELAAGRMPVVFVGRVNDIGDDDEETGEKSVESEGTAKALKAALIAAGVPDDQIGELHGGATKTAEQKKKAMDNFQSGKTKVMIATIQSGGTGINLDDTIGTNPRSLIMVTPPFTANDMTQALGRVNRLNTKSDVRVRGILSDTAIDDWNAGILERKFQTLGAVVKGNTMRGSAAIGSTPETDPDETPFEWGESLHPVPKIYHNTPYSHNELIGQFGGKRTQQGGEWTTVFPSQAQFDRYKEHVKPKEQASESPSTPGASSASPQAQSPVPPKISVSGNTFAHKEKIKAAGGRWDSAKGVWTIPPEAKAKLEHLNGLRFSGSAEAAKEAQTFQEDQRQAIHDALKLLAGNDEDRAREKNNVGFNQMDSAFGASLADAPKLTDKQAAAGAKLLLKYHRQVPEDLHKKATSGLSLSAAWDEQKHPRGQPENAGEFGPDGGAVGGDKPKHGSRASALHAKNAELLKAHEAMKKERVDTFNAIKADAEAAHTAANKLHSKINDAYQNIAWDEDRDGPEFGQMEEAVLAYEEDGTAADRFAALKEIETAAKTAAAVKQAVAAKPSAETAAKAKELRALADEKDQAFDKLRTQYQDLEDAGDKAGMEAFQEKHQPIAVALRSDAGKARSDAERMDSAQEGVSAEELKQNQAHFTAIQAHARAARQHLRTYVQHRKELAAIRAGEPMDVQLSMTMEAEDLIDNLELSNHDEDTDENKSPKRDDDALIHSGPAGEPESTSTGDGTKPEPAADPEPAHPPLFSDPVRAEALRALRALFPLSAYADADLALSGKPEEAVESEPAQTALVPWTGASAEPVPAAIVAAPVAEQREPINLTINITNPPIANNITLPAQEPQPPPNVTVNVPAQPPATVVVQAPPPVKKEFSFRKDRDGQWTGDLKPAQEPVPEQD